MTSTAICEVRRAVLIVRVYFAICVVFDDFLPACITRPSLVLFPGPCEMGILFCAQVVCCYLVIFCPQWGQRQSTNLQQC